MKGLVRWGRLRRISGDGSSRTSSSDITASASGRVIAAGGEDLSTPAISTNDRNGAQGATSEVGRTETLLRRQPASRGAVTSRVPLAKQLSRARRIRSLLIAAILACLSVVVLPLSRVGKSMCFRQSLVTLCLALSLPLVAHALDRTQLAVVVNTLDPLSVQIGDYYAAKRRIPFQNLIKVSFAPGKSDLNRSQFEEIKLQVDRQSRGDIQAYALTWVSPYRVDCMSITTAFAFGFDTAFCAEPCKLTRVSPYFNSPVRLPFTQLGIRPTMSIAAASFDDAKALIDRGVLSDGTFPIGTAYLLSTSETARNVRS
jgi:hypothetical protein